MVGVGVWLVVVVTRWSMRWQMMRMGWWLHGKGSSHLLIISLIKVGKGSPLYKSSMLVKGLQLHTHVQKKGVSVQWTLCQFNMKPSLNPTVNQFQFAQLLAYFFFFECIQ